MSGITEVARRHEARGPTPSAPVWAGASAGGALALSAATLAVAGGGTHGLHAALQVTGRLNFLLFWPAYTGGALVTLFGARFEPLRRRGRALGLAFAAALSVHLGLVLWLCLIGEAPGRGTFVLFGIAVGFVALITLFSWPRAQARLGPRLLSWLRAIGMNYVLFAFSSDFLDAPFSGGIGRVLAYAPFAVLCVVGAGLWLAAQLRRLAETGWRPRPADG